MELNYEILEKLSTKYGDAFYLVDSSVFRRAIGGFLQNISEYPHSIFVQNKLYA